MIGVIIPQRNNALSGQRAHLKIAFWPVLLLPAAFVDRVLRAMDPYEIVLFDVG